ncbi:MAG: GNAT family N-acetyltransferase [Myxococcota bacterium]
MSVRFVLRPANEADFAFVHSLRAAAYHAWVEGRYGVWDDQDQRRRLRAAWAAGAHRIVLVSEDRVGYVDWFVGGRAELRNIVLASEVRGMGLGTEILGHLLAEADARRRSVWLQAFPENPAVRLYRRLGFVEESVRNGRLQMVRPPKS